MWLPGSFEPAYPVRSMAGRFEPAAGWVLRMVHQSRPLHFHQQSGVPEQAGWVRLIEFAVRRMTSLSDSPCWYRLGSRLKSRVRASREGTVNFGRGRVLATIFGGIQNSDCHGASEWPGGVRSNIIRLFIATKTKQVQHPLDIDNAHRFPPAAALRSTKTAK